MKKESLLSILLGVLLPLSSFGQSSQFVRNDGNALINGSNLSGATAAVDQMGTLMTNPWGGDPSTWWYYMDAADITDTAAHNIKAGVAGNYIYVSTLCCSNTSATASHLQLQDGGGNLFDLYLPANGGQMCANLGHPIRASTINSTMKYAMVTTATATRCSANGFISPK